MTKLRLILVDDHTVLRAGIRAILEKQPDLEVVAEADSASTALQLVREHQPDVILLDLSLPGGGSLALIERLAAQEPRTHVLVLTMHDEPAYARAALAAGATGYVVKTISEQDLVAAVRAVSCGKVLVDLDDEKSSAVFASTSPLTDSRRRLAAARLSEREAEVLRLLGQGHSNQSVAEQLDLSPKTVATYRARIAEKLGLRTTADFVRYARETGLLDTNRDLT